MYPPHLCGGFTFGYGDKRMIPLELGYRDVYLRPQKCAVKSRRECDTSVKFGPRTFSMPVFAANMKSVVNEDTCRFFVQHGFFYSMHRFGVDNMKFIESMREDGYFASVSIGIKNDGREGMMFRKLDLIPEYLTVDVANAYSDRMETVIKNIKNAIPETFLIVGNVSSKEAVADLEKWGADAIKVGIGQGKTCLTRVKTGFTRPMITTILECTEETNLPIISDGGIEEHGDIAKALSCGASMVMAGALFDGYDESAGDVMEIDGKQYKEYFGSASEYNKEEKKNIEGKKILISYKGSMVRLLQELKEDLQSSISYAGGKDLSALVPSLLLQVRN
ncbi:Inosine-5'-monophosphate dehydrogenase [uncultured archaeon]|nr:Inosine-5'-monophosphate dehydrogenase [uncultured archaeon]